MRIQVKAEFTFEAEDETDARSQVAQFFTDGKSEPCSIKGHYLIGPAYEGECDWLGWCGTSKFWG